MASESEDEIPKLTPLAEIELPAELQALSVAVQNHVEMAIEMIADRCLSPGNIDQPWAGRDDVIKDLSAELKIGLQEATEIVREAHTLLWSQTREDDAHVQRELALCRLRILRRKCAAAMMEPVVETRYIMERAEGNKIIKVPQREKVTKGLNIGAARLALTIEGMIQQLMGARKADSDDDWSVEAMLGLKDDGQQSAELRVKRKFDVKSLSPEAQRNIRKLLPPAGNSPEEV